jgi:hypothetical protein
MVVLFHLEELLKIVVLILFQFVVSLASSFYHAAPFLFSIPVLAFLHGHITALHLLFSLMLLSCPSPCSLSVMFSNWNILVDSFLLLPASLFSMLHLLSQYLVSSFLLLPWIPLS